VQAERPAVRDEVPDDRPEFRFHHRRQVGARLEEVLEVRRGEDEHLARPIHSVDVVPGARACHLRPPLEVSEFLLGFLGEEVIGETHRQCVLLV
jgi:hypothetical protein